MLACRKGLEQRRRCTSWRSRPGTAAAPMPRHLPPTPMRPTRRKRPTRPTRRMGKPCTEPEKDGADLGMSPWLGAGGATHPRGCARARRRRREQVRRHGADERLSRRHGAGGAAHPGGFTATRCSRSSSCRCTPKCGSRRSWPGRSDRTR